MHYSAPGKLFISGEWSILEVGNIGMVAAVNNRVHVDIEKSDRISVTAEDFDIRDAKAKFENGKIVFFDIDDKKKDILKLPGEAVSVSLRYLEDHQIPLRPFKITTSSREAQVDVNGEMKKVGFGSSAAVVVATVAAVLDFHGYAAKKDEIYKLSTIAHYFAQGKVGSAFDVAASTYGGLFVYSRFDPDWLTKKMEAGEKLSDIIKEKWPSFIAEELAIPDNFRLLVAWTKESASTVNMVKQMNEFKKAEPEKYSKFMGDVANCARSAIKAWKDNDQDAYLIALQNNREALARLGKETGLPIETNDLRLLAEVANECGAAGKLSGAGGGDCGIAVCFDEETARNVIEKWKETDLYPLDVTIDKQGVRRED
ncbi:MAG: phosphomevalonate kinase [Candidatus Aenigmarchaeota archaeon]|nr:phosphomevalonate kinase [Candidatus Aenigmarchaeota archaeon]